MSFEVVPVKALQDNLCYLIHRPGSNTCAVVDPSEAGAIREALSRRGWKLGLILNTHHHHDHVGGNLALKEEFGCDVVCSRTDFTRVPGATRGVGENDHIDFGGGRLEVIEIPGHTQGQIAFIDRSGGSIFVGDTVFSMGCGRLFEGTAEQMTASLAKIAALAANARLYFGHEYTEKNAAFAILREPSNHAITERLERTRQQIAASGFAAPPTIASEVMVNPFLRLDNSEIRRGVGLESASNTEVLAKLRELRNGF